MPEAPRMMQTKTTDDLDEARRGALTSMDKDPLLKVMHGTEVAVSSTVGECRE